MLSCLLRHVFFAVLLSLFTVATYAQQSGSLDEKLNSILSRKTPDSVDCTSICGSKTCCVNISISYPTCQISGDIKKFSETYKSPIQQSQLVSACDKGEKSISGFNLKKIGDQKDVAKAVENLTPVAGGCGTCCYFCGESLCCGVCCHWLEMVQ